MENKGFKALQRQLTALPESVGTAFQNLWGGAKNSSTGVAGLAQGVVGRAAGAASALIVKPTNWMLKNRFLGPLAIVGGGVAGALAIKKHYADKRDAINASPLIAQPPASPYVNSVSPAEYAAMEARMRDSAAGQPGNFAAAEADKRAAATGTVVKG